ncbi:MAG: tRNA lysidine(34) synthetase TilS [Candidatus Koribacter versatilis]|uniref:tRNA(Ile)-lysidine synthase n=1 Tax=Candidatus Korobacter versatilis TaxID=658062 RepID=A0A932EPR2_9BACT|nr:tRNA lysidine(34) synthetase TilS [Candidatus Koribacter versatilis]
MQQGLTRRVALYCGDHGLMKAGDRVGVACSGGPDSVALLRVLLELRRDLGIVVAAVTHFNHKLRGDDSEGDERFVRALAEKHGLEFLGSHADTAAAAEASGEGVEGAARKLRYEFFGDQLRSGKMDCIATGHTLDDQAETVLMRVVRGAGTRGLAAIRPLVRVATTKSPAKRIVRPLLGARRREVLAYLAGLGQDFREDASNQDPRFLRNRIRHELLPLLERDYNPQVAQAVAQMAEIARAEEQHWEREVGEAWRQAAQWRAGGDGRGLVLNTAALAALPLALQRRLLQQASEKLGVSPSFQQIEAVRELAGMRDGTVELPGGVRALRAGGELRLWVGGRDAATGYERPLRVPGETAVPEAGSVIRASKATGHAGSLLHINGPLTVRNWRAGDRFYPQHSGGPKKVKELLTTKKVTGPERDLWPVVAAGERIVWLRGWGVAADAVAAAGSEGVRIEEVVSEE